MSILGGKPFLCISVEERRRKRKRRRTKEHFWFDVSTFPLGLIYTEEAYKQEYLIGRHEESCHLIFQMLSAMDGDLAEGLAITTKSSHV